jgi:ankyrin repeat protein
LAAEKGHEGIVKLLLAMDGVDADSKDTYGRTPLWLAADNGHQAIVRLLLEDGVTVHTQDKEYQNMLQAAAYNGYNILLQLLTRKEINSDISDDIFEESLQLGCIKGHMDVVQQLLYLGANPNKADEHGWIPLLCASWFGQGQILNYLLSNGGDRDLLSLVNTIPPNSWSKIDKSIKLELDENSMCVRYIGKLKICIFQFKFYVLANAAICGMYR